MAEPKHEHPHAHPLAEHGHPHDHDLVQHVYPHEHEVHNHIHKHEDIQAMIRGLLDVFEAGPVNTAQLAAIRHVRMWLGDVSADFCPHELTVYEEGDRLICQKCRKDLTSDVTP